MSNTLVTSPTDRLRAFIENAIGYIEFNQPQKRNAMSLQMWEALGDTAASMAANPKVKAVVMRGVGGKAFVSGDDVSEFPFLRSTEEQKERYNTTVRRAFDELKKINKPVIAYIEGACIGAGLIIALLADIRIARAGARFGIPAAKVGVGCEYEGFALMARLIGSSSAKDMFFTGRYLDTDEAYQVGLVNKIGDDPSLAAYCSTVTANAPLTIQCVKEAARLFDQYSQSDEEKTISDLSKLCYESNDYQEGIRAFIEKRSPVFRGT